MSRRPLRLAHRGDWRDSPENTVAAFAAALAVSGCDGLEFDVRAAADGVPVVIHDDTLARVQQRPGRVEAMTAAELGEAGVPMLSDVLAAVGSAPYLDVELKVDVGRPAVEVLAGARGPAAEGTVVSSFSLAALETVRRLAPGWPLWLNSPTLDAATISNALTAGCAGVAIEWRALNAESVGRAQDAGLDVAAWTVRSLSTFEDLARLGVVAVCVEDAALDG